MWHASTWYILAKSSVFEGNFHFLTYHPLFTRMAKSSRFFVLFQVIKIKSLKKKNIYIFDTRFSISIIVEVYRNNFLYCKYISLSSGRGVSWLTCEANVRLQAMARKQFHAIKVVYWLFLASPVKFQKIIFIKNDNFFK